jgi:NADP-dependent 3-hydroxy acid dehydrogenase YdfG
MGNPLIVITGATSGIGMACAKAFSQAHYPLLLIGRRAKRAEALNLPNCHVAKVDVTDIKALQQAVHRAEATFGPVGGLINNAGVMLLGQFDSQSLDEWQQMLQVNVTGVLNGIKTVMSGMLERKTGSIINISSVAGHRAFANHGVYCATKFAVTAITETLRQEGAEHNVRCMQISPGVVETELLGHTSSKEIIEQYEDWKKVMTALAPEDIARSVMFAYEQPAHVCIRDIIIAPTGQKE